MWHGLCLCESTWRSCSQSAVARACRPAHDALDDGALLERHGVDACSSPKNSQPDDLEHVVNVGVKAALTIQSLMILSV